jgi:hypothetical protein
MSAKINVLGIVTSHFQTLRDLRTGRRSLADLITFVAFPVAAAAYLVYRGVSIPSGAISILLTCLSIFVGLLFNLLVLAHAMRSDRRTKADNPYERPLLREINANLEYSILVALVAICILLVPVFVPSLGSISGGEDAWRESASWLAFGTFVLLLNFILTLFMILKRMHSLLFLEYADTNEQSHGSRQGKASAKTEGGSPARSISSSLASVKH